MRIALAIPLLLLGACQVNVDDGNDSATAQYDEELAQNTAADVSNEAERIAGQISNDVQEEGSQFNDRLVEQDGSANSN